MPAAALTAMLVGVACMHPALARESASELPAAASFAFSLPAGPLWPGLQAVALATGQRIFVPAGSATLAGLEHPAIEGSFTADAALDLLLADTTHRWERDARGSILIVPRQRAHADLDTLRIAASAASAGTSTTPASGEPSETRLAPFGPRRIEGARLTTLPAQNFDELLRRAPNVSGQGTGLAIRGIERGAAGVATSNVYLDGIPLGTRLLESAALPPLQRVHYLRGPRSLWEGAGAMAGVIRLETADPLYEFGADLRTSAAYDDHYELRGAITGQLGRAGPALRLNVIEQHDGGSIDNAITGAQDIDRANQTVWQGRLLWEPDALEALTVRASFLRLEGDPGSTGLVPPAPGAQFDPFERESHEALPRSRALDAYGAAAEVDWRFGDNTLLRAYGVTARTALETITRQPGNSANLLVRNEEEDSGEAGLRWEQVLAPQWRLQVGADVSSRDVQLSDALTQRVRDLFPVGADITVTPDATRRTTTSALGDMDTDGVFAQVEWATDRGGVVAGVRRIGEDRSSDRAIESRLSEACTIRIGDSTVACADEVPDSFVLRRTPSSDHVWVPNLRATWEPAANHRFGVELRRGYVGGGARLDTGSGTLAPFRPERSDTIDFTWSAKWWGGALALDAAVFYNDWTDRHVPVDLAQRDTYIIVNAGAAHAYGGEFEVQWIPTDTWQAWLGVGLLHTAYDEFQATLPFGDVDLRGKRFPGAPPLTLTAGARWNFATRWQLGLSHWFSRAAYSDALNTPAGKRAGYGVLDINLRREIGKNGTLEVFARNALDKDYLDDVRIAGSQSLPREYFVGDERRIGVAVDWRW